ncbi:Lipoprotein [Prescottella defluvii]|uniref:hypothetical protein n=1 Tax=Prescottella defluvii TaxID=1323361 RepID=UPI0004F3EF05|nr:hypothetical protein [Prescottella defluvii]
MSRPALPLTAGTFLLAAALTGCSASDTPAAPESTTVTEVVTETVTAPATAQSQVEEPLPMAPIDGPCTLNQAGARVMVVQGTVECGTLNEVWAAAVADPAFAIHGNRNTIVVGDWTCRAHETAPVPTGFCEDAGYRNKFKVVRAG